MFPIEKIKQMSNLILVHEYTRSVRLGMGIDHPDAINMKNEIMRRMTKE